jgi:hypothetical protein
VLAPLYELLSTVRNPELSRKLIIKIGRKHLLKALDFRHWDKFAADCRRSVRTDPDPAIVQGCHRTCPGACRAA